MTVYFSRVAILFIAFMFTPAFKGGLIIMAIIFDAFTTSLGLSPLVFKRMKMLIANTPIALDSATYFSIFISAFFAILLVCSIAVSMFHRKGWQNKVLGLASIIISFKGVCGDAYDNINSVDDITFSLIIETLFYLAFAIAPVIYVSMHSKIITGQFREELESINTTSNEALKDWVNNVITKQMNVAEVEIDVDTSNQKGRKEGRRKTLPQQQPKKQQKINEELELQID